MDRPGFTERASKALTRAREIAARLRSAAIEPEHVILGMLEVGEGFDIVVLRGLLVDLASLKTAVESKLSAGTSDFGAAPELSPAAKKLIEGAVREARALNHGYIGKEHLLLALARDEAGIAAEALREAGVTYEAARQEVLRVLSAPAPKELKRYNLALPEDLFREVERLAQRQNTTVVEVLRRFVKLGLFVTAVLEAPDGAVVVRQEGREKEIVLL